MKTLTVWELIDCAFTISGFDFEMELPTPKRQLREIAAEGQGPLFSKANGTSQQNQEHQGHSGGALSRRAVAGANFVCGQWNYQLSAGADSRERFPAGDCRSGCRSER